jgi:hypothetical protein
MATDPKQTLKELEDNFKLVEINALDFVNNFGGKLEAALKTNITESQNLIKKFENGKDITKDLNKAFKGVSEVQKKLNDDIAKQIIKLSQVKGAAKTNIKLKIDELNYQKKLNEDLSIELKELEKLNEEKQKQTSLTKSLGNELAKNLGFNIANVKETLTLSGIFSLIISKALEFNKTSVELSKNLGYAGGEADRMLYGLAASSVASNNINLNSQYAAEAIAQMSEATGYVAEFSQDALETQILLTKQFGLTGAEAARIYELSVLTGKSSSQVNDEMVGAFAATRNQLRVGVPFKATMAAAAKVSGQLAANLQNNPALITKAVVQAAALGTTLEQTASQAEKLLDFSSSIESELKAELLTGKQLNLERARAAALAGDQVTLAQELAKNVGSLEDFQKLNVIQQKALAEAVGLTADQLAEQLKKQQIAKETGKSIAEQNKEELLQAQARQNLQDKLNAVMLKLSDILNVIASGPIGMMLSGISSILSNSYALYGILGLIAAMKFSNLIGLSKSGGGLFSNLIDKFKGGKDAAETASKSTKGGGIGSFLKGINPMDMIKGAGAILILSGALYVAAKAFQELSKVKWDDVGMGAIALVGFTAAVFGLGALIAGPGAIIFGAGIVGFLALGAAMFVLGEGLSSISGKNVDLLLTASALQSIATSLVNVSSALVSMDISKLDALDEFANNRSNQSIIKGITDFILSPIQEVNNTSISGENQSINTGIDLTPMITAINEVKAAVDRLYSKDTTINMDGKRVGSTLTQGSLKLA